MKTWFEMKEVRRRHLADAVWIPLHVAEMIQKKGNYGYTGYREEYFGVDSIAIPTSRREDAKSLDWSSLGGHSQRSWATKDYYKPVDVYQYHDMDDLGIELVIQQNFDADEPFLWHLNQDLVCALELKREGDLWIRPNEDYCEVVRLRRDSEGAPVAMEIKNEFLRDYLCARNMFVHTTLYRRRSAVATDAADVGSPEAHQEESGNERFEVGIHSLIEGGDLDGGYAVFRVGRTDVDPDEDVPNPGPETDFNTEMEQRTGQREGRRLVQVTSELWRSEDIEPVNSSIRVRRDRVPASIRYIIDASGETKSSEELNDEDLMRWLWFQPEVVPALLKHRGSHFEWYTQYTGGIGLTPSYFTHFGLNSLGLVNVYAYDIAKLPVWHQRIWSGYNLTPEGGVSTELISAQARAVVAQTAAPETIFSKILRELDELFVASVGSPLLRKHADTEKLVKSISRFRALEPDGLFALAKDIMRVVADRIDSSILQKIAPPPKGEKWGSLKSIEKYLATIVSADDARLIVGPLAGAYDLRVADAHLAKEDLDKAYKLVRVDPNAKSLDQGFWLIATVVSALMGICRIMSTLKGRDRRN